MVWEVLVGSEVEKTKGEGSRETICGKVSATDDLVMSVPCVRKIVVRKDLASKGLKMQSRKI